MFRRMLAAALKAGHRAKYVLGDAWFGCKENIATALECGLEAIFQMKRGLMKYRIDDPSARSHCRRHHLHRPSTLRET
ncbi:MAG: hypothetical protein R3F19_19545 [Verrucomicrobiales bacterium]